MIKTTQKIIKVGSSDGITLPAKELRREKAKRGDMLEITARVVSKTDPDDAQIIAAARKILQDYRQDFKNLSQR